MATKKTSKKAATFAEQFADLEQIVQSLEEETDLDTSMKQFEKGLQLSDSLKKELAKVENTIERLKNKYSAD